MKIIIFLELTIAIISLSTKQFASIDFVNDSLIIPKIIDNSKISNSSTCGSLCGQCYINVCFKCIPSAYFYNKDCLFVCPVGTYKNEVKKTCLPCHRSCPVCWDELSTTCGTTKGVYSQIVDVKDEIISFLKFNSISNNEIDDYIQKLSIILKDDIIQKPYTTSNYSSLYNDTLKQSNLNYNNKISYSISKLDQNRLSSIITNQINERKDFNYTNTNPLDNNTTPYEKELLLKIDTPMYSLSINNMMYFIVPYCNNTKINNQYFELKKGWIYKKGVWNQYYWDNTWIPKINTFILNKGDKSKLYYENGNIWYYNNQNEWKYTEIKNNMNLDFPQRYANKTADEIIDNLNSEYIMNIDELKTIANLKSSESLKINNQIKMNKLFATFNEKLIESINELNNIILKS